MPEANNIENKFLLWRLYYIHTICFSQNLTYLLLGVLYQYFISSCYTTAEWSRMINNRFNQFYMRLTFFPLSLPSSHFPSFLWKYFIYIIHNVHAENTLGCVSVCGDESKNSYIHYDLDAWTVTRWWMTFGEIY